MPAHSLHAAVVEVDVETGATRYDEWSHMAIGMRFRAGAMGLILLALSLLVVAVGARMSRRTMTSVATQRDG